ncbi:MAG: chromosome segregation protein SMC [Candidatus Dadabacteria bacterium]|nr:chromosome segregation protein SMC [Candidatus Dadabacteria bacterium]
MRITSLELVGFKSFYNKTTIHFHPGINAVVGPNGCGKTNIFDSLRWVLGEQNPRRIRAGGMEEVISNGSSSLKPLGMAEVSLTLTGVADRGFDEILIQRRLFRSGESEYFINGVPSRLKDIVEMFLDTGAGARAYTVVDLANIEQLINPKSDSRVALIEEIAGIQKYKLRRRETMSRIESTEDNLSRVRDVLGEIKRQMAALSRQAKQAEQFKKLSKEALNLELMNLLYRRSKVRERRSAFLRDKEQVRDLVSKKNDELSLKQRVIEEVESEIIPLDHSIESEQARIAEATKLLRDKSSFLEVSQSELQGIDAFIDRLVGETRQIKADISSLESQVTEKRTIQHNVLSELRSKGSEIDRTEALLRGANTGFTEADSELEAVRKRLFDTMGDYTSAKGSLGGLESELSELRIGEERSKKELDDIDAEIAVLADKTGELKRSLVGLDGDRAVIEKSAREVSSALKELGDDLEARERDSESISEDLSECASRLNALKQIDLHYEWLPEQLREFLAHRKGNGVIGVAADFISVPKEYEKALEVALGEKLKWVLVADGQAALDTAESLRDSSFGKVTLLPLTAVCESVINTQGGGDLNPLIDYISVEDVNKAAIESLLDGVFVVSSITEAARKRESSRDFKSFVTMDGDLLDVGGSITVGTSTEGVFERKREIEELSRKAGHLATEKLSISGEIEQVKAQVRNIENDISEYVERLVEIGIKEAAIQRDISNVTENQAHFKKRGELVRFNLDQAADEVEKKRLNLERIKDDMKRSEISKEELERQFAMMQTEVQQRDAERKARESALSEHRVTEAALGEKSLSLTEDIEELEGRLAALRSKLEGELPEIETKRERKGNLIQSVDEAIEDITELRQALGVMEEALKARRREREGHFSRLKPTGEEKEELRGELFELARTESAVDVELSKVGVELEHLDEEICGLRERLPDDDGFDMSDEYKPDYDEAAAEEALHRIRSKIEGFGAVNLLAPEEYKDLEERHSFLSAQVNDLNEALATLRGAMEKIDRESNKRFHVGFELVDKKFREVFGELFNGGEGKLILIKPDDSPDTEVEMMARPKGKKYQSVNLLSGGEKTLSSIALILSACFIRPAPFLLFDEIDAPLDDSNTGQLANILEEISAMSQVIIITHNKHTMGHASSLIGITSDNTGLSRVVSVDLSETGT